MSEKIKVLVCGGKKCPGNWARHNLDVESVVKELQEELSDISGVVVEKSPCRQKCEVPDQSADLGGNIFIDRDQTPVWTTHSSYRGTVRDKLLQKFSPKY